MRQEDQVIITIGYNQYVMPAKAGMALFTALTGQDIYRYRTSYEKVGSTHKNVVYIADALPEDMPTLMVIGPGQFLMGIENQRVKDQEEAAKEAAKATNAQ